jgi:hypothetical protein
VPPEEPSRLVHCEDAIAWLKERPSLPGCSLVTSLPDVSELEGHSLASWRDWFVSAAALVLSRCPPEGVCVFFQTDIKKEGQWVDKGYLVSKAAEQVGARTLWHKIVCRSAPGSTTFGRPAYSHLLCFAPQLSIDLARATPDVLPEAGEMTWTRAMGTKACAAACRFILQSTTTRTVVDPFCGRGTLLAVANMMGLHAVGVELSKKRARQARTLRVAATS